MQTHTHIPPHGFSKKYLVLDAYYTKVDDSLCYILLSCVGSSHITSISSINGPHILMFRHRETFKSVGGVLVLLQRFVVQDWAQTPGY